MKHDADQVIGHLQHYRTREGRRIRLARYRDEQPYIVPEPYVHDVRRTVVEVVAGVFVLGLVVVGLVMWAWIGWASQVQPA